VVRIRGLSNVSRKLVGLRAYRQQSADNVLLSLATYGKGAAIPSDPAPTTCVVRFPLPCRADRGGLADMNRVQRRSSHNSHADRHVISVEQTAEWTPFEVRGESLPFMIIQSITKISHVEIPEIRPWQMYPWSVTLISECLKWV